MNASSRFSIVRALAFAVVLGIIYIFRPEGWSDWLFSLNAVLMAGSLASLFFWRVGNDPARSAIGFPLVARPLLFIISAAAFALTLWSWRKCAMSLDLVWVFVLVFNWMMYRSIVEHIDEVQAEHAATDWYRETDEFFKVLRTEPADAASARTLRALQEEFRLSNKFAAPEAEGLEAEISSELGELQKELQAGAAISERAERIKRLFARRNILLAARLNQSK